MTGDSLPVLGAIVRGQGDDLAVHTGLLLQQLATALPPQTVRVQRVRHRFRRDDPNGAVCSVVVTLGEQVFGLQRSEQGRPEATVAHCVGGIVLRTEAVTLDVWAAQLTSALRAQAEQDADTATALTRLTGFTT